MSKSRCTAAHLRSISRPAIHSHPKKPSCGTQPAHFRVDTRRYDTLDTFADSSGQRGGGRNDGCGRRFTLPT